MTGESRLADFQCVYQLTHAKFPAPQSSNNADACRIHDSLAKGGKVSHCLPYIGLYRYIKRDVNVVASSRLLSPFPLFLVLTGSFYTVDQTEQVIITQFGQSVGNATEPGLHFNLSRFEEK
jgi:hypothetical protein